MSSCRLCGDVAESFRAGGLGYAACPACGYVGLDPVHFPSRNEEERRYRLHRNSREDAGYVRYLLSFAETVLAPRLPKGASVLDFGSGPEPVLAGLLAEAGWDVGLYDPCFAADRTWSNRTWDCVVVHEVAEHFRDPVGEFRAAASALAPGGLLAVRTRFLPADPGDFEGWWYRMDPTHVGFLADRSVPVLAGLVGCEVVLTVRPDLFALRRA